jgi:hypothetical protein
VPGCWELTCRSWFDVMSIDSNPIPYRSMSPLRQALTSSPCGQDIRFQIWWLDPVARLVYDSLPKALDHPFDHPDDPTRSVWSRPDRRGTQREQARSVWTRPDRRRAPGYGSGGQPGVVAGAAHWGPVPVGHRCRVVDGPAAGYPAWPLPQCPRALRRSRVSTVPGRAGSRRSAGRVRCPRIRTAILRWLRRPDHMTSADEQIRHARSCPGAATAAAGPPPTCRSRTLRPVSGWLHNRTLRAPWLAAAAPGTRSVSRRSVCGRLVYRTAGVRHRPCRSMWVSHRYRNRSPARRPLDGCRHRR